MPLKINSHPNNNQQSDRRYHQKLRYRRRLSRCHSGRTITNRRIPLICSMKNIITMNVWKRKAHASDEIKAVVNDSNAEVLSAGWRRSSISPAIGLWVINLQICSVIDVYSLRCHFSGCCSCCGGAYSSPNNMIGSSEDGQYATIWAAEPYGVIGWIGGGLNQQTTGAVYVYGYGTGPVEVYTSAGYLTTLYPSGSAGWIYCGNCASSINSITFVARKWAQFYIDAVNVQP